MATAELVVAYFVIAFVWSLVMAFTEPNWTEADIVVKAVAWMFYVPFVLWSKIIYAVQIRGIKYKWRRRK